MPESVNGPVCQCGEDMDTYHGIKCCPHCDQACTAPDCPACRKYGFNVNIRTTREHQREREQ